MTTPAAISRMGIHRKVDTLIDKCYPEPVGIPLASATVARAETGAGPIHKTIITCTAAPVVVTDVAGVCQYGGIVSALYTFPQGLICSLGAIIDGAVTMGATGTFIDAWAGVIALGSVVAAGDATLTSTEATWLQSTAIAAATAKVAVVDAISIATQLTESGARWFDGTTTAAPVFFNIAITDDATHTSGTGTFTGTVTLTWINLGDK